MLILHHLHPLHWAVAGAGIAAITLALLFIANRRLGISTGLEDVCSFVLPAPYFTRDAVRSARRWRLPFIAGLVLGAAALLHRWKPQLLAGPSRQEADGSASPAV